MSDTLTMVGFDTVLREVAKAKEEWLATAKLPELGEHIAWSMHERGACTDHLSSVHRVGEPKNGAPYTTFAPRRHHQAHARCLGAFPMSAKRDVTSSLKASLDEGRRLLAKMLVGFALAVAGIASAILLLPAHRVGIVLGVAGIAARCYTLEIAEQFGRWQRRNEAERLSERAS